MKKTLSLIISFILLLTATPCNRCVCCECKSDSALNEAVQNGISHPTKTSSTSDDATSKLVQTSIKKDLNDEFEESLYNKAKDLYLSGEWDWKPMTLCDQTISFSSNNGCLLVNGYIVSNYQWSLDLLSRYGWDSMGIYWEWSTSV